MAALRAVKSGHLLCALISFWAFTGGATIGSVHTNHRQDLNIDRHQEDMVMEVDSAARLTLSHRDRQTSHGEEVSTSAEVSRKHGCSHRCSNRRRHCCCCRCQCRLTPTPTPLPTPLPTQKPQNDTTMPTAAPISFNQPPTCELSFDKGRQNNVNNLGGFHPSPMFANMRFSRFERVCHALNTDLALQVINRSTYNSETMKQGSCDIQEQNLPSVSVKSGTSVDLIFDFTAAWNGYKHADPVGIFYITVLDLEQGMAIEASNYTSYSLGFNSSIKEKTSEKYKARFVSGKKGPVGENTLGDAEGRPRHMTPDQKKIAISFQSKNLA